MKCVTDTTFWIGLLENSRSFDDLVPFLELLKVSFVENAIDIVIPFRVLTETEHFDINLAKYLDINFAVEDPVEVNEHQFFLNLKHANARRGPDQRWFNPAEITDLEVITIARDIHQASPDVTIVTNDEGIQKAASTWLPGIKTWDTHTFLGYLLGITNDAAARDAIDAMSRRAFAYYTRYRTRGGRAAVPQVESFFAEMLNAIRMAREDAEAYFDPSITTAFDRHVVMGKELDGQYDVFAPCLGIVKDMLAGPAGSLATALDARLDALFLELNALAGSVREPTNYTRFYNYLSTYLLRVFISAFKEAFMQRDTGRSTRFLAMAKLLAQSMLQSPPVNRIFVSLVMVEILVALVTRARPAGEIEPLVSFLGTAASRGTLPSFVPAEMAMLLVAVYVCRTGGTIAVTRPGDPARCRYTPGMFSCSSECMDGLLGLAEELTDELAFFGQHELAVHVLTSFQPFTAPGSDDRDRIESKVYLNCLILGKNPPACASEIFNDACDVSGDELPADLVFETFTPLEQAGAAFTRRIKVLGYQEDGTLSCWVYPLRSRFVVRLPPGLAIENVERLKEFRILEGSIKITPLGAAGRERTGARAAIELGPGCIIEPYHYQEKFFTLNVV